MCEKLKNQKQLTEVFCKKGVLKNFADFKGKHLCRRLLFIKVVALRPATFSKRELQQRCFTVNFAKFFKNINFIEHFWATAFEK